MSLQGLPVIAVYFALSYDARAARLSELVILAAISAAFLTGPFAEQDGTLGPVNLIGAGILV